MNVSKAQVREFIEGPIWQTMLRDIEDRMALTMNKLREFKEADRVLYDEHHNPHIVPGGYKPREYFLELNARLDELEFIRQLPYLVLEDIDIEKESES